MRFRSWLYGLVGAAFVVAVLMTIYDQVVVEYGDDDSYVLGKATAAVFWILTLATPFAVIDFFRWLRKQKEGDGLWLVVVVVGLSLAAGFLFTLGWSLEWVVEGDIIVTFGPSELLGVVVALWSAVAAALVSWLILRDRSDACFSG